MVIKNRLRVRFSKGAAFTVTAGATCKPSSSKGNEMLSVAIPFIPLFPHTIHLIFLKRLPAGKQLFDRLYAQWTVKPVGKPILTPEKAAVKASS
jgi:hypothetical protein